jgi:hypothetical protein
MGKINKYSNLYDKEGKLIKQVNDEGVLTQFTIKEIEELVDTLDKNTKEYQNAIMVLTEMYKNPKTKEDIEYVESLQKDLIKRLQDEANKKKDEENRVVKALGEVKEEINNEDTESNVGEDSNNYNVDSNEDEYVEFKED